jgi:hypothetical protein
LPNRFALLPQENGSKKSKGLANQKPVSGQAAPMIELPFSSKYSEKPGTGFYIREFSTLLDRA